MNEVTLVQPYNPEWISWFDQLKAFLEPALVDLPYAIEHVGSTAIPEMTAKPIIDLDIIVDRPVFPLVKDRLAALGYLHQGDLGIADREAFKPVDPRTQSALPPHHLYVCIAGAPALRDHLAFRDFMRQHPEWVDKLSQHKVQLCKQYHNDRESYIAGKSEMVREITIKAGLEQ